MLFRSHPLRRARMNCTALRLSGAQWVALAARARVLGLSPSALFYGVLAEGWACWSSTRHFVLSILVSRRLPVHTSVSSVLGSYYSVFPLEVDWRDRAAFSRRVQGLSAQMGGIFQHRWCAGVDVLAQVNRLYGRTAQAALPYVLSSGVATSRLEGVPGALMHSQDHVYLCYDTPQTLVDVIVNPAPAGAVVLTYMASTAAFPAGLHGGILRAIARSATRLARDADSWLAERPLTPAEDEQPTTGRCGRAAPSQTIEHGLLCDALLRQAAAHPSSQAVATPTTQLTYAQSCAASRRVAGWLQGRDAAAGDRVVVMLHKCAWMPVATVGVHVVGSGYVPIDPALPVDRISGLLAGAGVGLVLRSRDVVGRLSVPCGAGSLELAGLSSSTGRPSTGTADRKSVV